MLERLRSVRFTAMPRLHAIAALAGFCAFSVYLGFAPTPPPEPAFVMPPARPPWFTPVHFQRVASLDRSDPELVAAGMIRAFGERDYDLVMAYADHSWRIMQTPASMVSDLRSAGSALIASPRDVRILRAEAWREELDVFVAFDSDQGPQERRMQLVRDPHLGGWCVRRLGPPGWTGFHQMESYRARIDARERDAGAQTTAGEG